MRRVTGNFARMVTSERTACWRSTIWAAMCSASSSTCRASPITTVVDALGHRLGEAGHVHALLTGVEVDEAVDLGVVEELGAGVRDPDHLVDAGDSGAGQGEMDVGLGGLEVVREG